MSKPVAVLTSDVHYNLNTLELADAAMRQAIAKANSLEVPLIVAGDLHDTKASMRAECINAMIDTFSNAEECYILVGNHDKINEKSDSHALNFLLPQCHIVESHLMLVHADLRLIPYYHNPEELKAYLKTLPKGSTLIMHQGVEGSHAGDYIQDKTALPKECFDGFRVISGHYHQRQDIKCGKTGLFSYIGNPYTLNYGEATDPEKGFQILMEDGSLEFVPTNLRKHVVIEIAADESGWSIDSSADLRQPIPAQDLVWVRINGTKEILNKINKEKVANFFGLSQSFKLESIPTDTETIAPTDSSMYKPAELLDVMIGSLSNTSEEQKERIRQLWRNYEST